jgi:hypothetical protein
MSFPIVLTALPQKFSDPSWAAARIIGPDALADSLAKDASGAG